MVVHLVGREERVGTAEAQAEMVATVAAADALVGAGTTAAMGAMEAMVGDWVAEETVAPEVGRAAGWVVAAALRVAAVRVVVRAAVRVATSCVRRSPRSPCPGRRCHRCWPCRRTLAPRIRHRRNCHRTQCRTCSSTNAAPAAAARGMVGGLWGGAVMAGG